MQIRGGRGYETEPLARRPAARPAVGVERWMRDARINLIFEGSSEIMHLFMAREAVDKHLQVAGVLIDPKVRGGKEARRPAPAIAGFYLAGTSGLWLRGLAAPFRYRGLGRLGRHLRFVDRASRKLARQVFHGMVGLRRPGWRRSRASSSGSSTSPTSSSPSSASVSRAATAARAGTPGRRRGRRLADRFSPPPPAR